LRTLAAESPSASCLVRAMNKPQTEIREYDFSRPTATGILICAGGFEDRALAFVSRLRKSSCSVEAPLVLHYESQREDNEPNFERLVSRLRALTGLDAKSIDVHADRPVRSFEEMRAKIVTAAKEVRERSAIVDVSAMTHLWALGAIHACLTAGLRTSVVYTEARWYSPLKRDARALVRAWQDENYGKAEKYLQSAALKNIHIVPQFAGNFRPGRKTCLMVFVGYEPNRIKGLVDDYAPGALIVLYGRSPHEELRWRTKLSRDLHEDLFSRWHVREVEISTLEVSQTVAELGQEFRVVREDYDVALAPHCSKMQALASYVFWRRHPEVQLLFTSPVRFNPERYSRGARTTWLYDVSAAVGV